jgi:V8-like Glu-specific endopeptidase
VEQALVAQAAVAQPPAPVAPESQDSLSAFEALFAAPSSEQPPAPQPEEPAPSAAAQLLAPPVVAPAPAPASEAVIWAVDPLLSAPAPQGAPALVPPPMSSPAPVSPAPVGPASGPTSVGHWSTQSDIDDAEQVNETTISRSVGVGSGSATSALVLPSVPEHTIGGPMNSNGDVMLTGSISLPHSFSATGAHPSQLDESDLDHLLDPGDHQVANTDSMPVRATRAISTNTASGAIIAPSKPAGTRGFTILIIAASAMAVVVVGLLVAGLVSGTL